MNNFKKIIYIISNYIYIMSLSEKQENHYGSIIDNLDNRFEQKKEKLLIDINNTRRSKEINKYYTLKTRKLAVI